jgi:hypothetical protein
MRHDSAKYHIAKLIYKSIANINTADDKVILEKWLDYNENKALYNKIIDKNNIQDKLSIYNQIDTDKIYKRLEAQMQREQDRPVVPIYRKAWFKYTAAASIALLVSLTIFLNKGDNTTQFTEPIIVNNNIEVGTDKATLTLTDGSNITLEKGQNYETANAISNGEELVYNTDVVTKEIAYNTLTIPRGGQFNITLSDGTKVWLNSESQLKYPESFIDGQTRQVELVYGEAYFNVSPSTEHKGAKFRVFNNAQEVEVLGTEFNIKAYKDETNIYTTLLEGKVAINTEYLNKVLKPGEQSNFDITLNTVQISEVDIFREVSWKDGTFSFKHKSLKDIMTVLSRWYDMDVVFRNKEIENVTFNGTLYKNQSIEEILVFIQSSINTYEINNKTIILK